MSFAHDLDAAVVAKPAPRAEAAVVNAPTAVPTNTKLPLAAAAVPAASLIKSAQNWKGWRRVESIKYLPFFLFVSKLNNIVFFVARSTK